MTETAAENQLNVEDVVSAVTGPADDGGEGRRLRAQVKRVAGEFDKRTADAFGRALLDSLCEDPGNVKQLNALLILGLAHGEVLRKHRISLVVEGRRLAALLERSGDLERAQALLEMLSAQYPEERAIDHELAGILRRSGNTGELVDRYMERAEECVARGKIKEAIPWLQEVLLLDRSRRDVARIIRDLRYQEADRHAQVARRNRLLLIVVLLSTIATAIIGREKQIADEYRELVAVSDSSPRTLYARFEGLDRMIGERIVWTGVIQAAKERKALQAEIEDYELKLSRLKRKEAMESDRMQEMAESARLRGLMYFERSQFDMALADFKRSLAMCKPTWEHKDRVEADIAALEEWRGERQ